MKLLVLSDLHIGFGALDLEINGQRIDADADVIVLAGDIDEGTAGMTWARTSFPAKPIVYVAGNHEFYSGHFVQTLEKLRQTATELDIHFLENDSVEINSVRFLGCTLWTDFELLGLQEPCMYRVVRESNDYTLIKTTAIRDERMEVEKYEGPPRMRILKPRDTLERHLSSRDWLEEQLATGDPARTVVVTHHAPSKMSVAAEFLDRTDLCPAYASNLESMMGGSALWIHGHLHTNSDYMVAGTRVVCNPRGYWSSRRHETDNPDFRSDFLIDV